MTPQQRLPLGSPLLPTLLRRSSNPRPHRNNNPHKSLQDSAPPPRHFAGIFGKVV